MNRYPLWKYALIVIAMIGAFIYAAPNIYGEYPAVQIMGEGGAVVDSDTETKAMDALHTAKIPYHDMITQDQTLLFRFIKTEDELKAPIIAITINAYFHKG